MHTNKDSELDPFNLWLEIIQLREAVKGPYGFATWKEAATAERLKRVKAESDLEEAHTKFTKMRTNIEVLLYE